MLHLLGGTNTATFAKPGSPGDTTPSSVKAEAFSELAAVCSNCVLAAEALSPVQLRQMEREWLSPLLSCFWFPYPCVVTFLSVYITKPNSQRL